jgi:IS5 family transposase
MKQISLATTGFELVTKRTRKRKFLDEMNLVIPWSQLLGLIALSILWMVRKRMIQGLAA